MISFHDLITDLLHAGSFGPSSRALADVITKEITKEQAPVIELGAGSGVFTQRLVERGIPEDQLTLIESRRRLALQLAARFPSARVVCMDAADMVRSTPFGGKYAGAVVSGLPLLSMSETKVISIIRGAFSHLRSCGSFYQFTYGARCSVSQRILSQFGLEAERIGLAIRNFPPATVYRLSLSPVPPFSSGESPH